MGAKVEIFQIGWKRVGLNYFAKSDLELTKSCSQTSAIIFTFTEKQPAGNNQHISSFKQLFQESALKVGYMKNLEQIIN